MMTSGRAPGRSRKGRITILNLLIQMPVTEQSLPTAAPDVTWAHQDFINFPAVGRPGRTSAVGVCPWRQTMRTTPDPPSPRPRSLAAIALADGLRAAPARGAAVVRGNAPHARLPRRRRGERDPGAARGLRNGGALVAWRTRPGPCASRPRRAVAPAQAARKSSPRRRGLRSPRAGGRGGALCRARPRGGARARQRPRRGRRASRASSTRAEGPLRGSRSPAPTRAGSPSGATTSGRRPRSRSNRAASRGRGVALGVGRHLRARWLPAQDVVALVQDGVYGDEPGPRLPPPTRARPPRLRPLPPRAPSTPRRSLRRAGDRRGRPRASCACRQAGHPRRPTGRSKPERARRGGPDGAGVTVVSPRRRRGPDARPRAGDPSPPAVVRVGAAVPVGVAAAPDGAVVVTTARAAANGVPRTRGHAWSAGDEALVSGGVVARYAPCEGWWCGSSSRCCWRWW